MKLRTAGGREGRGEPDRDKEARNRRGRLLKTPNEVRTYVFARSGEGGRAGRDTTRLGFREFNMHMTHITKQEVIAERKHVSSTFLGRAANGEGEIISSLPPLDFTFYPFGAPPILPQPGSAEI